MLRLDEKERKATRLAPRRDKDSAVVKRSKDRGRLSAAQTTNGGAALAASFKTDVVLDVFEKKAQKTPREIIENCKRRIGLYDA